MQKKDYPKKKILHRTNQRYLDKQQQVENILKEEQQKLVRLTPLQEYEAYQQQYLRKGYLDTQTVEANKTLPVKDVKVEVFKEFPSGEHVIDTQLTDESGLTQRIELPALDSFESLVPGFAQPYTTYNLRLTKPGYTTIIIRDIPIYEDIVTFQQHNMSISTVQPDSIDILEYSIKPPVV